MTISIRRTSATYALALLLATTAATSYAGGSDSFQLDWRRELAIGVPAAALFACGHFMTDNAPNERSGFGWIDDTWTFPYSESLDTIGDISTVAAVAALPLLLDALSFKDSSTIAVMYAESALWTIGLKDVLKATFGRPRPYLSYEDTPADLLSDEDRFFSFPSGHSAFAFMTASFVSYVYGRGDSSAASKMLVGASVFAVAGGTAVLRVTGGVHHPSDVAAGALIGSAIGILVPWLHERSPDDWKLSLAASTISVTHSY